MVKCLKVQRSSRSRNCCLPIETEFIWSKNYRFFMAQFFLVDRDVFFLFVVCMHIYIFPIKNSLYLTEVPKMTLEFCWKEPETKA